MRIVTAAIAAAAAAALVGCGRPDDMEEMVRAALVQANIRRVEVRADEGGVRLTGTVDTLADRTRAVELATAIIGTAGEVENEIAVTGLGPVHGDSSPAAPSEAGRP